MPRLGHKKSRNGCQQCKTRHVKCDEQKPCSNCKRHGVKCTLVQWDENAPDSVPMPPAPRRSTSVASVKRKKPSSQTAESPGTKPSKSLPLELVLNPSPAATVESPGDSSSTSHASHDPFPYLTRFMHKTESAEPDIWLRDLELMHHWTTEACFTLCVPESKIHIWQITAPQHAMTHTFLMHELLAYSALHLAFLHPEHRAGYSMLSSHHQNLAIRAMRTVLQRISADNCHALFATSALITLTAFGTTTLEDPKPQHDAIDELLDRYNLVQGMFEILRSTHIYINQGPFAALLNENLSQPTDPVPVMVQLLERLDAFSMLLSQAHTPAVPSSSTPSPSASASDHLSPTSSYTSPNPISINSSTTTHDNPPPLPLPLPPETLTSILDALTSLANSIRFCTRPGLDNQPLRISFLWPVHILPLFLTLLKQRHPVALAVLAHYCVVLYAANGIHWALRGWGRAVCGEIERCVMRTGRGSARWGPGVVAAATGTGMASGTAESSSAFGGGSGWDAVVLELGRRGLEWPVKILGLGRETEDWIGGAGGIKREERDVDDGPGGVGRRMSEMDIG